MADPKDEAAEKSTPRKPKREAFDEELAQVQLETAKLALEQQKEVNAEYMGKKAARARANKQRQAQLANEAANSAALQAQCRHRQGGQPGQEFRGSGPSVLTRSRVFFDNNYVIQCARCGLKMQRPHPNLKKLDPAKYRKDMELYERLFRESEENNLPPMEGPTFSFTDADGIPIIPTLR